MTNMDVAIGIRRTIVQHKAWATFGMRLNLLVQPVLLPVGNPTRLTLGQVTAHRKCGIHQVECCTRRFGLVVLWGVLGLFGHVLTGQAEIQKRIALEPDHHGSGW